MPITALYALALACLLLTAQPAHADDRIDEQIPDAIAYWAQQGVTGCPDGIQASIADTLHTPGAEGEAIIGSCEITIASSIRTLPDWYQEAAECVVIRHEVGHALGIAEHEPDGVMAAHAAPAGGCEALIRPQTTAELPMVDQTTARDALARQARVKRAWRRASKIVRVDRRRALARSREEGP